MQHNNSMIRPCPFSKGYGIPRNQAWLLLNIFFFYRFAVASLLVVLFFSKMGPTILGLNNPQLYIFSSLSYLLVTIIAGFCIFYRYPNYTIQAQLLIFTDIIFITLIIHASGGVISGLGILLTVSTAAGGLLIGGRCAMLFAAMASLAILAEQIYSSQTHAFAGSYSQAGMLGASFFTIAYLAYFLAQRNEQTELIANQREQTISQLEVFNQYIIQHLQSGIIIVDKHQQINMLNETALRLFNLQSSPGQLSRIAPQLSKAFHEWQHDLSRDFVILNLPSQFEIHVHFTLLPTQHNTFYMLTLEDLAQYNQRLQQSKLASLGRLSASIAHEIRNPLGAISHAAQLLSESPALPDQDKRLTAIIETHSQRVNRIIEDILQLSKKKTSNREKIELVVWLHDYLEKFIGESVLDTKQFSLISDDHAAHVFIDPHHLKQIMDNLCQNALKYGSNDTQPGITIKTAIFQHAPCIEVIDNGPGVSEENVDRLFEPFFTTSTSGTGLGLYISRELADINQAKLSYSLTESTGSCFRLCFPDAEKVMIEI